MSDPTGLGQVANALSAPVTKLIEVVAAGCGKVYGPTGIRREARAQADALLIKTAAEAEAPLIAKRAVERLIAVESRRQENIEAIVEIARQQLPEKVSEEPVHPDWATRFFRDAQDVSDDLMRALWARLLAGEVASPGKFSARTLSVVRDLARVEAVLFTKLLGQCARANRRWLVYPEHSRSFTHGELLGLVAAGLLMPPQQDPVSMRSPARIETVDGRAFIATAPEGDFTSMTPWALGPDWSLTPAAVELLPLSGGQVDNAFVTALLDQFRVQHWKVERSDT